MFVAVKTWSVLNTVHSRHSQRIRQRIHCRRSCCNSCWGSGCVYAKKVSPIQSRALCDLYGVVAFEHLLVETTGRGEVAARAEVAPGEKVVGIDLGTTNSAVAAMEVWN